jgi:hypothetical protein
MGGISDAPESATSLLRRADANMARNATMDAFCSSDIPGNVTNSGEIMNRSSGTIYGSLQSMIPVMLYSPSRSMLLCKEKCVI